MVNFLWALGILLIGVISLFIAGLPVTCFVFHRKGAVLQGDSAWALAPFMGYAVLTIPLKILVKLDCPVQYSAWPLLAAVIGIFIYWTYITIKNKRLRLFLPSKAFCIFFSLILLLTGFAYLIKGAAYYRGFGWWDTFFYGSQAEFLKTAPFSQLNKLAQTQPYLGGTIHCVDGNHRIGRGVLQAFVASISGVDGASTLGFISVVGVALVFCALLYATKDVAMRRWMRYAACAAGAMIPSVALTQLEGFIPVCLFTSFSIVLTKLFIDLLDRPSMLKSILIGGFVAAVVSTLFDGIYLVLGLSVLAFVVMLLARRARWKDAVYLLVMYVAVFVMNIPYWSAFLSELGEGLSHSTLNNIYPFAYSPKMLNWAFFGSTLETLPNILYMPITLLSLMLLITGVFGIISLFVKEHLPEGLLFCAMICMPLLFWISKEDLEYSFYKVFSFAVPLIAFGVWYFGEICMRELKGHFLKDPKNHLEAGTRKIVVPAVAVVLCGVFALSALTSVRRTAVILKTKDTRPETTARVQYLAGINGNGLIEQYEKLDQISGENILIVAQDISQDYWWLTYYARRNVVWGLTPQVDDVYFGKEEYERTNTESIPLDVRIVWSPYAYNMVVGDNQRRDYAAMLQKVDEETSSAIYSWVVSRNFVLRIFAREQTDAVFRTTIGPLEKPAEISIQGQTYEIEAGPAKEYAFPISLSQGGQVISLVSDRELEFTGWKLEIE